MATDDAKVKIKRLVICLGRQDWSGPLSKRAMNRYFSLEAVDLDVPLDRLSSGRSLAHRMFRFPEANLLR